MDSRKKTVIGLTTFILLIFVLVQLSYTNDVLKLPSAPVTIEVSNGAKSHFDTLLSNMPQGYDVSDGRYLGWCVDKRYALPRSPITHEVVLHSSLSPPVMAGESWDMINYVLNHKQGTVQDVQQAIWYFVNLHKDFAPSTNASWAIVNEALANGEGFTPSRGQTMAVICCPTQPEVQVSIIEVGGFSDFENAFSTALVPFVLAMPLIFMVYTRIRKRNKEGNRVRISSS